jgi:hypothetical protein
MIGAQKKVERSTTRSHVENWLDAFAADLMTAARGVIRKCFDDSCGNQVELTSRGKVVVRLEVRRTSAYLEAHLAEVGDRGKIELSAHPIQLTFSQVASKKIPDPKLAGKLTVPQFRELESQERRGPQDTYGKSRARVQNLLVARRWSRFTDGGKCDLTEAGRRVLYAEIKRMEGSS